MPVLSPPCLISLQMQRRAEALAKLRAQRLAAGHIPKALRVQQGVKSGRRPGTKGKGRGRHRGGSAGEDLVEDDLEDGEVWRLGLPDCSRRTMLMLLLCLNQ